jgi:hypothetical protein
MECLGSDWDDGRDDKSGIEVMLDRVKGMGRVLKGETMIVGVWIGN